MNELARVNHRMLTAPPAPLRPARATKARVGCGGAGGVFFVRMIYRRHEYRTSTFCTPFVRRGSAGWSLVDPATCSRTTRAFRAAERGQAPADRGQATFRTQNTPPAPPQPNRALVARAGRGGAGGGWCRASAWFSQLVSPRARARSIYLARDQASTLRSERRLQRRDAMQRAWWLQIGGEPRRRRAAWAQCVVDGLARAPRKQRLGQLGSAQRPAGGSTSSLSPKFSRARRLRVVGTAGVATAHHPPCGAPSPMRRQTPLLPQDPPRLAPAPARAAAPPASPPPVWRQLHACAAAWTAALARAGQYGSFECGRHLLSGRAAQEVGPGALATALASRNILGGRRRAGAIIPSPRVRTVYRRSCIRDAPPRGGAPPNLARDHHATRRRAWHRARKHTVYCARGRAQTLRCKTLGWGCFAPSFSRCCCSASTPLEAQRCHPQQLMLLSWKLPGPSTR